MSPVKNNRLNLILILILVSIILFFRLYQLKDHYIFDRDQEEDAFIVTDMIQTLKPRLIGPRVANETGFFVGPFHYYFLIPFYIATKGNPYAGAYAAIFVALATTIVMFLLISRIFNSQIAFLFCLFYAANSTVVSWNVMYTPLLSILIFYLCFLFLNGHKKLFPWLIFAYSFSSTTHLVPASLIIPIIITLIFSRFRPSCRQILLSSVLFIVPLSPLILFDLKHHFLNLLNIINFRLPAKVASDASPFLFLRSFWRSINFLDLTNPILLITFRVFVILISLFEIIKTTDKKFQIFLLVWILTPLVILSFYRGYIPEYYFGCSIILIPILCAGFICRFHSKFVYLPVVLLFLIIQFQIFFQRPSGITLKNKLNLAEYLVNQSRDPIFNLSYDLPSGFNNGFGYIFKYLSKQPQNIPEGHLYSVFLNMNPPKSGQIVYQDNVIGLVRK